MKHNKLTITINKDVATVFTFCITPPNSVRWIPGIAKEETNQWPIKKGTMYRLQNDSGKWSEVIVAAFQTNTFIEWVTADHGYHCRYSFSSLGQNETALTYQEWVTAGELEEPFTQPVLQKLKYEIEK